MLMLLPGEIDAISEKKYYQIYTTSPFCFINSKIILILLIKAIGGYIVITFINVRKACLKKIFTKLFCSCKFGFYYYLDNILQFFIQINFW